MKKLLSLPFLALSVCASQAAVFVLLDENYDTAPVSGNGVVATQNLTITPTTTGDPTAMGHGEVGVVDISTGGQWGEARGATTQNISLPAGTTPGIDTFTASYDIYIPTAITTFADTDTFSMIIRWNIGNAGAASVGRSHTEPGAQDGWYTITNTGSIPLLGSDGLTTSVATPIISFRDAGNDDSAGVTAYVDNFTFSVTGVPEPTAGVLGLFGGLLLLRRRR